MDNMISLHLKMALLHKPTALRVISLEWMDLYSAKKKKNQTNNRNKPNPTWDFSPKKCPFDLVFPCGNREKAFILCCLVHLCGVVWLWQRGLRGSRKEGPSPPPPPPACVWRVCDEAAAFSVRWAPSLHLWTRVSREHRWSCTYRDTVHL